MGGPLSTLYFVRELCPKRDNASIPATFFHQDLHIEFRITQTPHFTVIHAILGMLGRGWWRFLVQLSERNRPVPSTISGCRRLPWRITDCRNYLNPLIKLYLHTHTRPACSLSFPFFEQLVLSSCSPFKSNLVPNISERMLATPFNKRQTPLTTFDFVVVTLIMVNSFSMSHDCRV